MIILDGGTTTLHVARQLPIDLRATVITNCPPIAMALCEHPQVEVVLAGGRLCKHSLVTVGAVTLEALEAIRADVCMLAVCRLHLEFGISVPDLEEAYLKRAMMAGAAEVMALARADKLEHPVMGCFCFRPLAGDEAAELGAYFAALPAETRRRFAPHPFDQATADSFCLHPAADVLRLVALPAADPSRFVAYVILRLGMTGGASAGAPRPAARPSTPRRTAGWRRRSPTPTRARGWAGC
ncbi:MAG: hypothetical protein IT317_16315 [Anaerolineales bacterium]|nr:hypothetical protein [Anaerolineales bacterium]